jgi:hypothetical protein
MEEEDRGRRGRRGGREGERKEINRKIKSETDLKFPTKIPSSFTIATPLTPFYFIIKSKERKKEI